MPVDLLRSCHASGDVGPLLPYVVREHACGHDFPHLHRLFDFVVSPSFGYRVCRCALCDEQISIVETDVPSKEPGVPLEIHGEGLLRWARDELAQYEDDGMDTPDCYYSHHSNFDWLRYA